MPHHLKALTCVLENMCWAGVWEDFYIIKTKNFLVKHPFHTIQRSISIYLEEIQGVKKKMDPPKSSCMKARSM